MSPKAPDIPSQSPEQHTTSQPTTHENHADIEKKGRKRVQQ